MRMYRKTQRRWAVFLGALVFVQDLYVPAIVAKRVW